MTFKKLFSAFFSAVLAFAFSVSVFAEIPNFAKWNECAMYPVLSDGSDSNSDVEFIALRVNPELESNQLHMLFIVNLTSFEDEANAGISISFNDLGTVELFCDGTADYDSEVFFAEIDNLFSDENSMLLEMEITVGIKPGIPDNLILSLNMYDTHGIASNTYEVDITDSYAEEVSEDEAAASADGAAEKTVKTKKVRTTKYKTTKVKTTKVKTTKTKTSKDNSDEEEIVYEVNEKNLQSDVFEDVHVENDKNKLIFICAAAVIACTAGGCAVGIANSRKKKKDRGDDK